MLVADDYQRIELITGTARRRWWTTEQKLRIIEASFEPGETVSSVARRYRFMDRLLQSAAPALSSRRRDTRRGPCFGRNDGPTRGVEATRSTLANPPNCLTKRVHHTAFGFCLVKQPETIFAQDHLRGACCVVLRPGSPRPNYYQQPLGRGSWSCQHHVVFRPEG